MSEGTSSTWSSGPSPDWPDRKKRVLQLLKQAAADAARGDDPWAAFDLPSLPAERVIRHLYQPESGTWTTDETMVKMEAEPFTHGAMRFCYRLKKRAQPPQSASNHRFHRHGWAYACNYVAKAYQKDGVIDISEEAIRAVQNDIILQYEAQKWAERFNQANPPAKIHFMRAYALEFPSRPGRPWLAVERFIAGHDIYGAGFVKHNTNSGFVDTALRRVTPQVFSAFSFYASQGHRLVADIQGVGNLFTDPQVLSSDYRFGDGDLGPRGMALFFKSFRHCGVSDAMGIPIFPLSRHELQHQAKYEDDEETMSDQDHEYGGEQEEVEEEEEENGEDEHRDRPASKLDAFQRLDRNRLRRASLLVSPRDLLPSDMKDTEVRSNLSNRASISDHLRKSIKLAGLSPSPKKLQRSRSDLDEVRLCLERAQSDLAFSHRDFHRHASGELIPRQFKNGDQSNFHRSNIVRTISAPITPTDETRKNLGKVHYQLAVLHGMCRFPEVVPSEGCDPQDLPDHDAFSVLFHLSYAAALHNAPACLALARVLSGLGTAVSNLVQSIVPTDFDAAKQLLQRAMSSPYLPAAPKAAAGCLLFQLLHDEATVETTKPSGVSNKTFCDVIEATLSLLALTTQEGTEKVHHQSMLKRGGGFHCGDRVEANYCLEGCYYSAVIQEVSVDGKSITVQYDDDGSSEVLDEANVRPLIPHTATQTSLGGPLSDEEAFGSEHGDDKFLLQSYELKGELAALKEKAGDLAKASSLFEEAADGAMSAGKMKVATEWSLKAAELQQ